MPTTRDIRSMTPRLRTSREGRCFVASIGIDDYPSWPQLRNAANDAKAVTEAFSRLGFQQACEPLLDRAATSDAIHRLVLTDLPAKLGDNDSLVLFFAGHGHLEITELQETKVATGYAIPADADVTKNEKWLAIGAWLKEIALLPARHILVILDCCHSGMALSVPRGAAASSQVRQRDAAAPSQALDDLRSRRSRRVIASALDDQRAMDGGPLYGHSLFAGFLLESLRGGIAGQGETVSGSELGLYLRKQLINYPESKQTPVVGGFDLDDQGELLISIAANPSWRHRDPPRLMDRQLGGNQAGMQPPPGRKALLRALLPFDDGDELIGRDREVQDMLTIVTSAEFRFGAVWGATGCGKTSLLRAGLLPQIRGAGGTPVYLPRPSDQLLSELEASCADGFAVLDAARPIVVVIDQLEEYFQRNRTRSEQLRLAELVARCLGQQSRRVSFMVGIRADFFGKLNSWSPIVPNPTSSRHCYELEELTVEASEEILHASLRSDATEFAEGLIEQVTHDLSLDGAIRPAELQIVATSLKRCKVRQPAMYSTLGGARGLLRTYIEDEIAVGPSQQLAHFVLRRLCAPGKPLKSPTDVSEDQLAQEARAQGIELGSENAILSATLERLVEARLIVRTDQSFYNLVHDYIADLIALATAGDEPKIERADRLLAKYLGEYQGDPLFRIPRRHLRFILRHASLPSRQSHSAQKLFRASVLAAIVPAIWPLAVVLIAVLGAYAVESSSEYLSTQPATFSFGEPSIVVRAGHPTLKFLPGFNGILVDTGFSMRDVDGRNRTSIDALSRETLVQFRWATTNGYSAWADDLLQQLTERQRIKAQRLLGMPQEALRSATGHFSARDGVPVAFSIGLSAATGAEATAAHSAAALREIGEKSTIPEPKIATAVALGLLNQNQKISKESDIVSVYEQARKAYLDLAHQPDSRDLDISWKLAEFEYAIRALLVAMPTVAKVEDAKVLLDLHADPRFNSFRSWSVLRTLETMADAYPALATMIMQRLVTIIATRLRTAGADRSDWSTEDTVRTLARVAEAVPDTITREVLLPLDQIIAKSPDKWVMRTAILTYGILAMHHPAAADTATIATIRSCAKKTDADSAAAPDMCALTIARLAGMDSVSIRERTEALSRALGSSDKEIAQNARQLSLRERFGSPDPAEHLLRNINLINDIYTNDMDLYRGVYEAAAGTPDAMRNEEVSALIAVMETSNWSGANTAAADALLAAARWQPAYLLTQKERLGSPRVNGQEATTLHTLVVAALARAEYETQKPTEQRILDMLQARADSEQRMYGIYAAYLFWLDQRTKRDALEHELRALAVSAFPDVRMSSNQALEMIWIGKLTLIEPHANPPPLARARLDLLMALAALSDESHVAIAARLSMERWIDERAKPMLWWVPPRW